MQLISSPHRRRRKKRGDLPFGAILKKSKESDFSSNPQLLGTKDRGLGNDMQLYAMKNTVSDPALEKASIHGTDANPGKMGEFKSSRVPCESGLEPSDLESADSSENLLQNPETGFFYDHDSDCSFATLPPVDYNLNGADGASHQNELYEKRLSNFCGTDDVVYRGTSRERINQLNKNRRGVLFKEMDSSVHEDETRTTSPAPTCRECTISGASKSCVSLWMLLNSY